MQAGTALSAFFRRIGTKVGGKGAKSASKLVTLHNF
jgi:hypothetical protein